MDKDEKKRHNAFEIRSLGELYKGRWEKKYWSSSRGKQRHPYPVGYHAVRTSSGHTYVMEIREGKTGPLFLVNCEDGISCTGATPNSAWEDVKKQHVGTKRLPGTGSCFAINGAEMFGFADPVVQFLLRELQASGNGEARPSGETCSKSGPEQRNENRREYFTNKSIPFGSSVIREGNRKRVLSQPIMQLSWTPMNKRPRSQRSRKYACPSFCTNSRRSTSMVAVTDIGQDLDVFQGKEAFFEGSSGSLAEAQISVRDKQEQHPTNEDCLTYKSSSIVRSKAMDAFEMSYAGDSEEIQGLPEEEPVAISPVNDKQYVPDTVEIELEKSQHKHLVVHDQQYVPDSVEVEDETSQHKDSVVQDKQYVPDSVESERMPHKQYVPESVEIEGAFAQHEKPSVHAEECVPDSVEYVNGLSCQADKSSTFGRKKAMADPDLHDKPSSFCASEGTADVLRGKSDSLVDSEEPLYPVSPVLENDEHIPDDVDKESLREPGNGVLADGLIVKDNESDSQLRFNSGENPNESDSLGQEVAKSMMSLLLPTAVPLLKRRSTKKCEQGTLTRELILDNVIETCRISEECDKQTEMEDPCALQKDAAGTKLDGLFERSHPEHPGSGTWEPDEKEDEVRMTVGQACEEQLLTVGKENASTLASQMDLNQGVAQQDLEYREFVSASKKLDNVHLADGNGGPVEDEFNQDLVVTSCDEVCMTVGQACEEQLPTVSKENASTLANQMDLNQGVVVASQQDLGYREFVSACKKLDNFHLADGNGGPEEDEFNQGLVVTSCDEVCMTACGEQLPTVGKENASTLASQMDLNQGVVVASQQDLEYREFISASKKLDNVHLADGNGGPEENGFNQGLVVTSQQDVEHREFDSGSKMLESLLPAYSIGSPEEEEFCARELDAKACDQHEIDMISGKSCEEKFERSRLASETGLDKGLIAAPQEDVGYRGFDSINKKMTISDMLEPVAALEHPLPVMSVVLNVRSRAIDLCVCCGHVEDFRRQIFVYRVSVNKDLESEARLMQSVSLVSREEPSSAQGQLECGIRFTPNGESLLVLGCFAFPQTSPQTNVVSLLNLEGEVQLELASDECMRCLLVTGSTSFIAGGDGGYIKEWRMDCNWRLSQSETVLPTATYNGIPFRTISRLLIVPNAPHLVIGCDTDGSFATWDISKRQLLSSCHTAEYYFQKPQLVDVSLVDDLSDDKSCGSSICLMAEVTTANRVVEDQTFWTMVALESSKVFVGNKLDDGICTATVMGRYGVAGTTDGRVFLWEFSTGRRVLELLEQDADSTIVHIATSPASAVLATVGQDGRVILYV